MARKRAQAQITAYVDLPTKKQIEAIANRDRRSVSVTLQMIIEKFLHDGGNSLGKTVS